MNLYRFLSKDSLCCMHLTSMSLDQGSKTRKSNMFGYVFKIWVIDWFLECSFLSSAYSADHSLKFKSIHSRFSSTNSNTCSSWTIFRRLSRPDLKIYKAKVSFDSAKLTKVTLVFNTLLITRYLITPLYLNILKNK